MKLPTTILLSLCVLVLPSCVTTEITRDGQGNIIETKEKRGVSGDAMAHLVGKVVEGASTIAAADILSDRRGRYRYYRGRRYYMSPVRGYRRVYYGGGYYWVP